MSEGLSGSCLCGTVTFRASGDPLVVGNCYCVDCRKSSGTSHCTHAAVSEKDFELTGRVNGYDHPADSGNIVSRFFCPACGSPAYSTNSAMPGMIFLRASVLDDLDAVVPQMTVYASRAPGWAQIDRSKPVFAEMMEGGPEAALGDGR